MTNIAHHTATADTHITKTGPDSFVMERTADQRLADFIARIGDEAQAREGPAESRMTSRDLSIARAAFRAGVKAGFIETTEAAVDLLERHTPAPAGGPTSHTNSMRVVLQDAAKSLRDHDHLKRDES